MATALSDRDLLAKLIAIDSTSRNSTRPIADALCTYLEAPGVRMSRFPMPGGEKENLLLEIGPDSRARGGLILSGHLDTVPADEPGWLSHPLKLDEREDKWYGRGTCDMKVFVALAANLFRRIRPPDLKQPLALLLTCDEELGALGAQHFAANWPKDRPLPRSVLIGEPTSLRAVRMHKGHLTLRIKVMGRAAHSGSPQLGINAIEAAMPLLERLIELRARLETQRTPTSHFFSAVPFPVLNLARLRAGDALNIVPDCCIIELGIRLLPGQDPRQFQAEVTRELLTASAHMQTPPHVELINDNPPLLTAEDAPLHRALCDLLHQRDSLGVSYASDGGPLSRGLNLDCILFGPGNIEDAHKPNEFVPVREVQQARDIVLQLIQRFCMA